MEILFGFLVAIVIIVSIYLILHYNKKQEIKKIKEKLKEIGDIKEVKTSAFDLVLTIKKIDILVKILILNGNKELSINSKRHWQVDATTKKLKLLKTGGFERLKTPKIIIVSPPLNKIVKYINENEVVFVKHDEPCFDFYLFKVNEIAKIEEVIMKKD